LLHENDPADFIVVDNLEEVRVMETHIDGKMVAVHGRTLIPAVTPRIINNFSASPKDPSHFAVRASDKALEVIAAIDGQVVTERLRVPPKVTGGLAVSDLSRDLLKIAVVSRYRDSAPSVGFVKGFGLKRGAIASSVAHDSHNIVAVGVEDEAICRAVNGVIECRGGICVADREALHVFPLPVAGLMTDLEDVGEVAARYRSMEDLAGLLGSRLTAPFMTLSFMALLVIPKLKLSDLGLFDGERFQFTELFCSE
jgi:adenine deaminase